MDIHRCRFIPYQPQSINALAFSHTLSNPKQAIPSDLRLALGRENGDVEIWNPLGGDWVQERIFRGSQGRTVEQLAWTQDLIVDEDDKEKPVQDGQLRLFSSGGSPAVTEWNMQTGTTRRHVEGNSGDIWCFAAQPQWNRKAKDHDLKRMAGSPSQLLAAGCSDGSVVLFSTADDELQYLRVLTQRPAKKTKVISLTWRDRNTIVAGYDNSNIRIIDVPSRSVIRTMSLGKSADGEKAVVWAVKCLSDGTILSGDSSGELRIWDAKTFSMVQRLKTHEADILSIATSLNGDVIYTAGVDRRTVTYRPVQSSASHRKDRWQQVVHRRYHQHDVKALAAFESKTMSVLVSGGVDTVPIVLPLQKFDNEYHRSLSYLPQRPQMSCSTQSRLMLTWWGCDLFVWHLPKNASEFENVSAMEQPGDYNHKLLARLQLNSEEYITAAKISDNGSLIAAATASGIKLFQLRKSTVHEEVELRTRSIELPSSMSKFGATAIGFSPDNKWLYTVRTSNVVALVKIVAGATAKDRPSIHPQVIKLDRKARKGRPSALGCYARTIGCVAISSDSRALATGDLSGAVDIWILEGNEDTQISNNENGSTSDSDASSDTSSDSEDESDSPVIHAQRWIRNPNGHSAPQLDSAILALVFKSFRSHLEIPSNQDPSIGLHPTRHNPHPVSHTSTPQLIQLVAITAKHSIVEFDVEASAPTKLSEWSRRNPASFLPSDFTQLKDRVMGAFFDRSRSQDGRLWLYGPTWIFMLDTSRDLNPRGKPGKLGPYNVQATGKKRKRNQGAGDEIKEGEWQKSVARKKTSSTNKEVVRVLRIESGLMSPVSADDDGDDHDFSEDIDMVDADAITSLRRSGKDSSVTSSPSKNSSISRTKSRENLQVANDKHTAVDGPAYWLTHRYRAIFGAAVLSNWSSADHTEAGSQGKGSEFEVVVIERPMYDVELMPRFDGGQDWTT